MGGWGGEGGDTPRPAPPTDPLAAGVPTNGLWGVDRRRSFFFPISTIHQSDAEVGPALTARPTTGLSLL